MIPGDTLVVATSLSTHEGTAPLLQLRMVLFVLLLMMLMLLLMLVPLHPILSLLLVLLSGGYSFVFPRLNSP